MTLAFCLMLFQLVAAALISRRARPSVRRVSEDAMVRHSMEQDWRLMQ